MELGQRIKDCRARAGMTQEELAEKLSKCPEAAGRSGGGISSCHYYFSVYVTAM